MEYISNAFSLQMIDTENYSINVVTLTEEKFNNIKATAHSVVGHPDTANVLGIKYNRASIKLNIGDVLYVAQLSGGRLPEGATKLPEGFFFKYLKVTIS
jgi:hypothetical protein